MLKLDNSLDSGKLSLSGFTTFAACLLWHFVAVNQLIFEIFLQVVLCQIDSFFFQLKPNFFEGVFFYAPVFLPEQLLSD